jgi:hypothetical protein
MPTEKDGGPAFPLAVSVSGAGDVYSSADVAGGMGMSLRDWFAGQALPAVMESALTHSDMFSSPKSMNIAIALNAYAIADTMLAERERQS